MTLLSHKLLLDSIYKSATDFGIITYDKNRVVTSWNVGAQHIIGYSSDEMLGHSADRIFVQQDRDNRIPESETIKALQQGRAADYRWHMRKDGTLFWADGVVTPMFDDNHQHIGYLKILRDITSRKIAEEEMQQLANFDKLTGLVNRFSFDRKLREFIAMSRRNQQSMALLALDLDRFKDVNDTFGHHVGDLLLKLAAQRMQQSARDTDVIARLGGDEFAVLLPNLQQWESAGDIARKLILSLTQPFQIEGREVFIGCSVGIAIWPQDTEDPFLLMNKADQALYRAKKRHPGNYQYFTHSLDVAAHQRSVNLNELRSAVSKREYTLAYQPIIDTRTGSVCQMEALLRFSNEKLSNVPLDNLINLAVESGLMPDISFEVLQEACRDLRSWKTQGCDDVRISINMCARELGDRQTPRRIDRILNEAGVEARDLNIEITEREILSLGTDVLKILENFRKRGLSLALDDFGTGYSALSYLQHLPLDSVKLDRGFLQHLDKHEPSRQIVRAIISLAKALNLGIIAEGVETHEQVEFLRKEKCDALQGYFYSVPLTADKVVSWLNRYQPYQAGSATNRRAHTKATSYPLS